MTKIGYKQNKEHKEKTRQLVKKQWATGVRKGGYKIKDTSNMEKAQKERNKNPDVRKKNVQNMLKRDKKKWRNSLSENKKEFYQSDRGKEWIKKYAPIISKKVKQNYENPEYYKKFVAKMRKSKVYQGGKSFEKYGLEFNCILRKNVRENDNNICQLCLRKVSFSDKRNLSVHHIDYNKKNNDISNLISLCSNCHSKTNFDRKKWEKYFKQLKKIKEKKYKNKEVIIIATRPCAIKMYPIWKKLKNKAFVINMGQHKELLDKILQDLEWKPDFDLDIMEESQTLSMTLSKGILLLPSILRTLEPKRVWVLGDTSSALAGAMVAYNNKIPLVHVEAGLRSHDYNNPYPEEMFRCLIDRMSNILLCPTMKANMNLVNEGIQGITVGNTIVDALEMMKKKLPKTRPIKEKYILATVHRRESFGDEMEQIFLALKELSKEIKVVLPAHPNPNVRKIIKKVGLKTVKPMNYKDFLWHLRDCEYVISDSGGIQEESPSFKKKVIVLRKTTERQELIESGYGILVKKLEKDYILQSIKKFLAKKVVFGKNPFGDGKTADKVINLIK